MISSEQTGNEYSEQRLRKYKEKTCFHNEKKEFDCNEPIHDKFMLFCKQHYKEWDETVDDETQQRKQSAKEHRQKTIRFFSASPRCGSACWFSVS